MIYWLRLVGRRLPLDRLDVPLMAVAAVLLFMSGLPFKAALIAWGACVLVIAIAARRLRKSREAAEAEMTALRGESLLAKLAAARKARRERRKR